MLRRFEEARHDRFRNSVERTDWAALPFPISLRYAWRMRLALLAIFIAGTVSHASPAMSQLISDRVEGRQRVCIYTSESGSGEAARQRRALVGLAQNCPGTFPWATPTDSAPPTARLQSERLSGESRDCDYEQLGRTWTFAISVQSYCPLTAGLIQQQLARPERQIRAAAPSNRRVGD